MTTAYNPRADWAREDREAQVSTVAQTAEALIHAARDCDNPHTEAARVVTGLWKTPDEHSRALLAAIEEHRVVESLETAVEAIQDARRLLDKVADGAGDDLGRPIRELEDTLAWYVGNPGWTTAEI